MELYTIKKEIKMEIKDLLKIANTGQEKCSVCGRTIPKDVQRISFPYNTRYGVSYKRVCALCILKLSKDVNKKPIKKWKEMLVLKELE